MTAKHRVKKLLKKNKKEKRNVDTKSLGRLEDGSIPESVIHHGARLRYVSLDRETGQFGGRLEEAVRPEAAPHAASD